MKIRKILSFVLCLAMLLAFIPAIAPTASAATPTTLYLKPNGHWTQANAWFAAYFFIKDTTTSTWVKMTDSNGDGIYEVTVPTDKSYNMVIFCRMNPAKTTLDWSNKWNQTGDLTVPTNGTDLFTVPSGAWDGSTTGWSKYVEPTYTVAGVAELCGTAWNPTATANDMTKNADGLYEKVYTNVAAGTHKFKVVMDHGWDNAWGGNVDTDGNTAVTVKENGSTVTIYFNATTKAITTKVEVPVVIPDLEFAAASLTLSEGISINFKADAALFGDGLYTDPTVTFVFNKGAEDERTFTTSSYAVSGDKYVFQLKNIRPDWMGDTVTASLTATLDGESVTSEALEYSIATYCYNQLEGLTAKTALSTLLVDILNYGAAAQQYTGYKTGSLVNKDLGEKAAWGTSEAPSLTGAPTIGTGVENAAATWKGVALYLRETTRIRVSFTADSIENVTVTATAAGATYTLDSIVSAGNGKYYVFFDGLKANQMRQDVVFTVMQGDTAISNTLTCSVVSYAASAAENGGTLTDMLHALINYGDSVIAYAN